MFKVIRKQTRPNTSVQFWQGQNDPSMTDEFRNYFYENYVLTGKFISVTPSVSSDGLELTNVTIWNSEADFQTAQADPMCQAGNINPAAAHCASNGITSEEISRETF